MTGPTGGLALDCIRVVDVSQGIPGPLCSLVLGELGAEVVKVEPPSGDWLREVGPFVEGESAIFAQLNRNKRGISLDLKAGADREVFRRLVAGADVLVEGYRPGVMERLGFGRERLTAEHPRLVYCSISGWGSKGPLAEAPASELDVQAFIGKNRQLGRPSDPPIRVGYDIVCANAAWAGAQGILAALYARERSGAGQWVETSLLDAAIVLLQWTTAAESNPDEWKARPLSGYREQPDHGFQAKDRPFLYDLGRVEAEWQQLCQVLEADELLTDPRLSGFRERQRYARVIKEALNPKFARWAFEELRALIQDGLGGSIVPLHDLASVDGNPQVEALEIMHQLEHPKLGAYRTMGPPWRFSQPIARLAPEPAPALGEHDAAVRRQLEG